MRSCPNSVASFLVALLSAATFILPCQSQRIIDGRVLLETPQVDRYLQDFELDGNSTDADNATDASSFFDSNLIFIVTANILEQEPEDLDLFVSTFVDSYNEGNVCDPLDRSLVNGTTLALGFDLALVGDSFVAFDRPVDSPHRDRSLQTTNVTDPDNNMTLTTSPTSSPSNVVDFGRSTSTMLVNVLGTCSDCPSDTALFANDVSNRRLRRAQACDGPNAGIVLEIFQSNLEEVLPEIGVFGWFELGSTDSIGQNLTNLLDDVVPSAAPSTLPSTAPTVSLEPSFVPTCIDDFNVTAANSTEFFDSNLLFIVSEEILFLGMDAQTLFVSLFIESYNEGNTLDPEVCDPFFRIAINGTLLAIGFELEVISEAIPTFDFTNSSISIARRLQSTNGTIPDSNVTESPSSSPSQLVNFTSSTAMLVNVMGTCSDCPSGTTLFSNDVLDRRLQASNADSLCGVPCTGPDSEAVFDVFQINLDEELTGVEVLDAVELGSTADLGDNLTDILDQVVPSAAPTMANSLSSSVPSNIPSASQSVAPSDFPSLQTPATPSPTEETPAPTEETPAPTGETPAPTEETPAPTEETPAPTAITTPPAQIPATPAPTACGEEGIGCNDTDECCDSLICAFGMCIVPLVTCPNIGDSCQDEDDCCDGLICPVGTCIVPLGFCGAEGANCQDDSDCCDPLDCLVDVCIS